MTEEDKNQNRPQEEAARSMTEEEVRNYQGLTLNENGQKEESDEQREGRGHIHFIHIENRTVRKLPFWKKALFVAGLFLVIASFFAVAWVLFLTAGIVFIAYWILRFLRMHF